MDSILLVIAISSMSPLKADELKINNFNYDQSYSVCVAN